MEVRIHGGGPHEKVSGHTQLLASQLLSASISWPDHFRLLSHQVLSAAYGTRGVTHYFPDGDGPVSPRNNRSSAATGTRILLPMRM